MLSKHIIKGRIAKHSTQAENELKRLEIDKKPAYDQFKSDSTAWINAYVAYVAALKA